MAKKKKAVKAAKSKKAAVTQRDRRIGSALTVELEKRPVKKKTAKRKVKKKPIGICFVMIPFKEPFNMYYQSIFKPAIKAADLDPVLASDLFRPSAIVADLWQMVQESKILLAELTTKNANVFYELGLAHAIGKPVVLVSETMDDVPFDLQQLRVLLYNKDDPAWGVKLSKDITSSLKETLASPVEAVPGIFRKKVKSQAPEQDAAIARIEALEQQMKRIHAPLTRFYESPVTTRKDALVKRLTNAFDGINPFRDIFDFAHDLRSQGGTYEELIDALNSTGYVVSDKFLDSLRGIFS